MKKAKEKRRVRVLPIIISILVTAAASVIGTIHMVENLTYADTTAVKEVFSSIGRIFDSIGNMLSKPDFFRWISIYAAIMMAVFLIYFIVMTRKSSKSAADEEKEPVAVELLSVPASEPSETDNEVHHRFAMLSEIDRQMVGGEAGFDGDITLEEMCVRFRDFAASRLKLYYSLKDIRAFIAGMAVSRFILMQGISGTGKTSLAYAFGQFLANPSTIIPIQPMWKESSDMLGYYNEFTKRYNETNMISAMYRAQYTKSMCVIVLDEINIARVEYYFAEFLSLMELPNSDARRIRVVSGSEEGDPKLLKDGEIMLSDNIWVVGTANNDDSTFAISDKVYDRAMIVNLNKKAEAFCAPDTQSVRISGEHFGALVAESLDKYEMTDRGRRKLDLLDKYLQKNMHISFGNRIMRQLEKYVSVYIACGGEELDAVDDIVTKKILRKLESQNPIYIKNMISGLLEYIDEVYGEGALPSCREYLEKLLISI